MYFLSIFCQISKEIEAVSEANWYFRHILTLQTARTVKDFIESSNYWFKAASYNPLPKPVLPTAGEGLEHLPASPA